MADGMLQGYESLRRRFAAISGPTFGVSLMRDLAEAAHREAGNIAPHKTGHLIGSIHVADVTPVSARVVASESYALFVEEDTKPHEIRPTKAAALAWATTAAGSRQTGSMNVAARRGSMGLGGKIKMLGVVGPSSGPVQFAKVVHHPGTTGQHFLRKGAEKAVESSGFVGKIVAEWDKAG